MDIIYDLLFVTRLMTRYSGSAVAYHKAYKDTEEAEMKRASSKYCQHMMSSCYLLDTEGYQIATTTSRRTKASRPTETVSTIQIGKIGMDDRT